MSGGTDKYLFAWHSAIIIAEDKLKLDQVAECLRNGEIPFTMHERQMLAELLVPFRKGAKVRAVMQGRPGRKDTATRDLHFYWEVQTFKALRSMKNMPEQELKIIGEKFGLSSKEARHSSLQRGKKIADAIDAANDE